MFYVLLDASQEILWVNFWISEKYLYQMKKMLILNEKTTIRSDESICEFELNIIASGCNLKMTEMEIIG